MTIEVTDDVIEISVHFATYWKYNLKLAFHWNWNAIEFKFYITFTHQSNLHAFLLLWMSLKLFCQLVWHFQLDTSPIFCVMWKLDRFKKILIFSFNFFRKKCDTIFIVFLENVNVSNWFKAVLHLFRFVLTFSRVFHNFNDAIWFTHIHNKQIIDLF